MSFALQYSIAFLLDLLFGDPRWLPHPVRGIGLLCTLFEKAMRSLFASQRLAGTIAFFLVLAFTLAPLVVVLHLLHRLLPSGEVVAAIILVYTGIACRDLQHHAREVYDMLIIHAGLDQARTALQRIVGRDTANLDEQEISRACVETVAENLVDGVMSPLFFGCLFSCIPAGALLSPIAMAAVGTYFYKTVNTMDSMYGYKNEKYRYFGTVAARVDDLLNFLPARLSGPFLLGAAMLLRLDYQAGARIFWRDRLAHASPNGGHPESAVAGILGIRLGGPSVYFGRISEKPTLGDATRPIAASDIVTANRLMLVSTVLFFAALLLGRELFLGGMA